MSSELSPSAASVPSSSEVRSVDVAIVGGGPAGLFIGAVAGGMAGGIAGTAISNAHP